MDKIEIIKKLRDETQLGISDCKSALEACGYNYDEAVKFLREKGKSIASQRSSRKTSNGFVGYKRKENHFTTIEICCETDFVARGETFSDLAEELMDLVLDKKTPSVEALLDGHGDVVRSKMDMAIAKTGENIEIKGLVLKPISDKVCYYIHNPSPVKANLGQIVSVICYASDADESKLDEMRKVAMHAAATYPRFLTKEDAPLDIVAAERAIYEHQAKESGRPESVIPRIVEGKMARFFEEVALMDQAFVVDPDKKVKDFINELSKELGADIAINDFVVRKLGA